MADVLNKTPLNKITVLIADPDVAQQQVMAECLRPRFNVLFANTLTETERVLAMQHPKVLLIDLDQPEGGDAKAFIHHLREAPETKRMVIGIVTNRATIHDKVTGFNAGADDYVVKPVNQRSFMYRVVLLLRTRGPDY